MPDATAEQPTLISPVRGRPFTAGNAGRKLGSKNRVTVIASSLLKGQTEALVRKAVELAKAGDRDMLKFLLGRVLPRERTIKFDMPTMEFADDGVAALGSIMRAVAQQK
jgi:methylmalonyl-CoA mutase cobalamin-binding subunit